jgi:zinc protease
MNHPTQGQLLEIINKVKASDIKANVEEAVVTELLDPSALKGSKVKKTADAIYGAKEIALKNGVTVLLYPSDREKDRISFTLEKKGGLSILPVEDMPSFDENIMSLFERNQGVSKFSSTDLTKALSGKNVSVNPYISELFHGISGNSTVKDLETAFQLMYLYFTDPRFDQNEYDTAIKSLNAILPNFMSTPTYPLYKALYKTAYGDNPRKLFVSPEIVEKANLQTIEKDYRKLFSDAAGAVAIIVGDFKVDEITPLVVKYFGSLPKGKRATDWVDPKTDVLPGARTNDFTTDMETPMTTVIDIYSADAEYSEKLRAAISAVDYILNMRYVTSLREEAGGTYGASVSASLERIPTPKAEVQISFNSKPASADQLRELAAKGFKELAEQGPTDSEFDMTIKNLQKNIPESRQRNAYWTSAIRTNYYYGEDRDQAWEAAVNALTADDIKAAAALVYGAGNFVESVQRPGSTSEKE